MEALTAGDLAGFLQAHRVAGAIIHLPEHTPTVEAAARVVRAQVDCIAKSVLFLVDPAAGEAGERRELPVLVIANGLHRVDPRRVADHLGVSRRRVKLAGPDAVLAHTGYPAGAVPPFGHPRPLRTLIDRRVLDQPEVYAGGGALDALLRIRPQEIVRAAAAETVDVVITN